MKLLPPVLPYIKDAARSVKRICQEEFKKVEDPTLTELLGIPTLVVTMYALRREGDQNVLHLWCVHKEEVAVCPKCGAMSQTIHDEEQRCVRHLDIWGKRTFLHFLSRRFDCDECGKTFTEELPFVEGYRRNSIDFERSICEACLSGDRKSIAARTGLSQSTVKDIINRFGKSKEQASSNHLIRILGIDEISLKKRHKQFVLIISDMTRKCILAILPDREKASLEVWISKLTDKQRKSIRFVSTDMWVQYSQAVRSKLPHAEVIVDRFHVMKQLNSRITQLRSAIQKEASPEIAAILKGSRWILVRNRCELSAQEESTLQHILTLCPELRTLYLLKEEFRSIFEKISCREKARKFLSAWMLKASYTGNKFLNKFVTTLKNWWEEILNYFIEGITNGFVEGLNGALRNIIRAAFGYRNFTNFKLRAFAEYGFPTIPR